MAKWFQRALLGFALSLLALASAVPEDEACFPQRSRSLRRSHRAQLPSVREEHGPLDLAVLALLSPEPSTALAPPQLAFAGSLMLPTLGRIPSASGTPDRGRAPPFA